MLNRVKESATREGRGRRQRASPARARTLGACGPAAVSQQVLQQFLRSQTHQLPYHPAKTLVGECLASNLLSDSVDRDAYSAHECVCNTFFDNSFEQATRHRGILSLY